MSLILRKEIECLGGKQLRIYDGWDGKNEEVVFQSIGPRGGEQWLTMTRDAASDLGRTLSELYGGEE